MIWLILLIIGTVIAVYLVQDSYYFQLLFAAQKIQPVLAQEDIDTLKNLAKEKGQELFPKGNIIAELKFAVQSWPAWVLAIANFTAFGVYVALTVWLPTYCKFDCNAKIKLNVDVQFHGTSTIIAGILAAVFSFLGSILRVPSGFLCDKIGGDAVGFIGAGFTVIGSAILMSNDNFGSSIFAIST